MREEACWIRLNRRWSERRGWKGFLWSGSLQRGLGSQVKEVPGGDRARGLLRQPPARRDWFEAISDGALGPVSRPSTWSDVLQVTGLAPGRKAAIRRFESRLEAGAFAVTAPGQAVSACLFQLP